MRPGRKFDQLCLTSMCLELQACQFSHSLLIIRLCPLLLLPSKSALEEKKVLPHAHVAQRERRKAGEGGSNPPRAPGSPPPVGGGAATGEGAAAPVLLWRASSSAKAQALVSQAFAEAPVGTKMGARVLNDKPWPISSAML